MIKQVRELPQTLERAADDMRSASTAVVDAGEAVQLTMASIAIVAVTALLLAAAAVILIRRQ